jgi:hypothetical protein
MPVCRDAKCDGINFSFPRSWRRRRDQGARSIQLQRGENAKAGTLCDMSRGSRAAEPLLALSGSVRQQALSPSRPSLPRNRERALPTRPRIRRSGISGAARRVHAARFRYSVSAISWPTRTFGRGPPASVWPHPINTGRISGPGRLVTRPREFARHLFFWCRHREAMSVGHRSVTHYTRPASKCQNINSALTHAQ